MKKEFQDIYDQIKAPQDWKEQTRQKMHKAGEKEKKNFGSCGGRRKWQYAAALTAAAALCILLLPFWKKASVYKTPLKDGEYYSMVELHNGIVRFVEKGTVIFPMPNAGNAGAEETKPKEAESETYELKDGAQITVEKTVGGHMERIPEKSLSDISGQKLFVTFAGQDGDRSYEAEFVKDDTLYLVEGTGATQKQFIDFLIKLISR